MWGEAGTEQGSGELVVDSRVQPAPWPWVPFAEPVTSELLGRLQGAASLREREGHWR